MSKIYFVPYYFETPNYRDSASVRYRVTWPAQKLPESRIWKPDDNKEQIARDFDCVIFQKVCTPEARALATFYKEHGKLIGYDLTDPVWIFTPDWFTEMVRLTDFVTVSSPGLLKELKQKIHSVPVYLVNDGELLENYPHTKSNYDLHSPPTLSWTGVSSTLPNLYYALNVLKPLEGKIGLKVITDKQPEIVYKGLKFVKWDLENVNSELIDSDIFINPQDPKINTNNLKSNNKTNLAGVLKIPCVSNWSDPEQALAEIELLLMHKNRRENNARSNYQRVKTYYNIERVCRQWELIISFHLGKISNLRFQISWLKDTITKILVDLRF